MRKTAVLLTIVSLLIFVAATALMAGAFEVRESRAGLHGESISGEEAGGPFGILMLDPGTALAGMFLLAPFGFSTARFILSQKVRSR